MVGGSSGSGGSSVTASNDPAPNVSPPRDSARGNGVVAEEEETTEVPVEYREEDVAFRPAATVATSSSHVPITKDSARGKGIVAEEEETTEVPVEYREEDVAFRPAATVATSSSHVPITKYDIAEHLPDEMLARLLEENPLIGEMVLRAKEERARAIAPSEAAERAEREQKAGEDLLREAETEERAGVEAQGPRVTAVAEAGDVKRPDYAVETYIPPTPHLFAPLGFAAYTPQRLEYDDEVMLRDP
ncbi:hypothetical protein RHMOL_Rhmol05G0160500 [Rhododendron molle]|uniref:Uncharacterized protein n=1 Tax=Rhododendron molle TaxID=49168 RepID=A0ACC0NPT2_RHOML|nr:hypothetical protein RHMOL_Rhmol05G0160500 [Rhododendron molle]